MYTPPGFLIAERVNGEDNYGLKGGVFVTTDGVDTDTLFPLLDKDSAAELAAIMAVHDYKSGPTAAIGVPGPLRLPVSGPILIRLSVLHATPSDRYFHQRCIHI